MIRYASGWEPHPQSWFDVRNQLIRLQREWGVDVVEIARMFRMSRRRVYEIVNHVTATPSTPDRLEPIDVAVLRRHASTVRSLWPDDAWTSASLGRWNGNPDDLPPPPKRSATKIDAIA